MPAQPITTDAPFPPPLGWRALGALPPTALVEARVQLHQGAQVANAAAISLLTPLPDDSHTSFAWDAEIDALVGHALPTPRPLRFALRVADLTLTAIGDDTAVDAFPLDGCGQDDALAWVRARVSGAGGDGARVTMRRHYEIAGPVPDASAPWRLGAGGAFRELAAWYANADLLLRAVAAGEPGAGPVICWPHHFDIATLIEEPRRPDGARCTIGVGLSPGDEYYAEPYLYVGLSPRPRVDALPELSSGCWHSTGWFGAVLTGTELLAGDGEAQAHAARAFVNDAVATLRAAARA